MRAPAAVLLATVAALLLCSAQVSARVHLSEEDANSAGMTELQKYVAKPDAAYNWTRLPQFDETADGYKVLFMNMTSQSWLTEADVDKNVWWHWVALVVPANLSPEFASRGLMYITGGNNNLSPPKLVSEDLIVAAVLAQTCQTVVTVLFQIPNSPIHFWAQPGAPGHSEDGIIAYGWRQFLNNPTRPEWSPYLPMTKAGLRAMDASSDFWFQATGSKMDKWIVSGASKRGWTSWLVAACDPVRVQAVVPIVFDELNFTANIHHHWRAYGGWSFALTDYIQNNITTSFDSPEFAQLMAAIDPINYASTLTMPKLILSTGGDEFLLPDNNDYYWPALQGEKHFHSFPNMEHSLIENVPLILETVTGFVKAVQSGKPRPAYSWTKLDDGTLRVEVPGPVQPGLEVTLWTTRTIDGALRRDFRLVSLTNTTGKPWIHPVFWSSSSLPPTQSSAASTVYEAYVEPPAEGEGWVAFVIELVFPSPFPQNGTNFRVSTAVSILPQTFPYPDCYAETCNGPLV